jgi:hypothetical protein
MIAWRYKFMRSLSGTLTALSCKLEVVTGKQETRDISTCSYVQITDILKCLISLNMTPCSPKKIKHLLLLAGLIIWHWKLKRHASLKRRFTFNGLQDVVSLKTYHFISSIMIISNTIQIKYFLLLFCISSSVEYTLTMMVSSSSSSSVEYTRWSCLSALHHPWNIPLR